MTETNFSAKEPSLGYYYQLRIGLYLILKAKSKPKSIIKIENLDDVVVGDIDTLDLYQTKLHINSVANLTDASADFWKTIRIWSEHITNGHVDAKNTVFTLMTTAAVGTGSFIENFKPKEEIKDAGSIQKAMLKVAEESSSTTNAKAYESFKALTQ
jgi:hypothetical protein